MLEKIYRLYKLIHPPDQNKPYFINIDRCLEILRSIDNNFNYKNINFDYWKYMCMQLSTNIFDYDKLDIIIHPFYDEYHYGYTSLKKLFEGNKKYINYIVPNKSNKNAAELHIFIKDLVYEIDSIVIFLLLNILLLEKNKNSKDLMDTIIICKSKVFDARKCYMSPLNYTLSKEYGDNYKIRKSIIKKMTIKPSKKISKKLTAILTKKISKKTLKERLGSGSNVSKTLIRTVINNICLKEDSEIKKIINYDKIPKYTIRYQPMNYNKCNAKLADLWANWCKNMRNIIIDYDVKNNENMNENMNMNVASGVSNNIKLHVMVGLEPTFKIITRLYPKYNIDKDSKLYSAINNDKNKYKNFDEFISNLENLKKEYSPDQGVIDILNKFYEDNTIVMKNDSAINCKGLIIPLRQYITNLKKIKENYDIVYEPILDKYIEKLNHNKLDNVYIMCIYNLFGINSYYMSNSINKYFSNEIQTINSIGSCGGISENMKLGDIMMSNSIDCWSNIIKSSIGKNIYENFNNAVPLNNIVNYKINAEKQLNSINNIENIKSLIYQRAVHIGKCCTGTIIPLETETLLNVLHNKKYLGIEMENYWIKKGAPNIDGIYMQYASDLTLTQKYKLQEKEKYSNELFALNITKCILRTTLGYILSNIIS